jgi:hypothetical protein
MQLVAYVVLLLAQLEPIEPTRPSSLSGTVVDRDGKPVSNAEIFLTDILSTWPDTRHITQGATRTDFGGRFTASLYKGFAGRDLSTLFICAYRPGDRIALSSPVSRMLYSATPLQLVLAPADTTSYRIVDPDGRPVAGARLSVDFVRGTSLASVALVPAELRNRLAARTDRDGVA